MINFKSEKRRAVMDIIEEMPGLTVAEIHHLAPEMPLIEAHRILSYWAKTGVVARSGKKPYKYYPASAYQCEKTVTTKPSANVMVLALQVELRELQEWKTSAIARFPDLAVAPIIIQARRIASKAAPEHADDINAGRKDNAAIVRAVVIALQEVTP